MLVSRSFSLALHYRQTKKSINQNLAKHLTRIQCLNNFEFVSSFKQGDKWVYVCLILFLV